LADVAVVRGAEVTRSQEIMTPIRAAVRRMEAAQESWRLQEPRAEGGILIRADIARAIRAGALLDRSPDDYLMAFGIGGSNPCRAEPVHLPTWETLS
jgi:hypothetical protein